MGSTTYLNNQGAYAYECYTGVHRDTKDLDIFVLGKDIEQAFRAMDEVGYETELAFDYWLGKIKHGKDFVDLIFSSANGVCPVTGTWFENAIDTTAFTIPVQLIPIEEMIWQKAFIMEKERFDGNDITHLILKKGKELQWDRLLLLFGQYWRILFVHIMLFGFVYPSHQRSCVPLEIMTKLTDHWITDSTSAEHAERECRGTLLSRAQYLTDIFKWGYQDARLKQQHMTDEQIGKWTVSIQEMHVADASLVSHYANTSSNSVLLDSQPPSQ